MRAMRVAVACLLLGAATARAADEPWDLWEERMTGYEPLRRVFVGRFPSPEAWPRRHALPRPEGRPCYSPGRR